MRKILHLKSLRLFILVAGLFCLSPLTATAKICSANTPSCFKQGKTLLLAANKSKHRASHHFSNNRPATGNRVFIFDPQQLRWAAYSESWQLIKTGKASGGKGYCRDLRRSCRTPRGTFQVHSKGSAGCKSSKYPVGRGGAPMPYCMFFHRGYAIHGSPDVPNYNASHGCIRVLPSAAQWLHQNFIRHGTTVIVHPY